MLHHLVIEYRSYSIIPLINASLPNEIIKISPLNTYFSAYFVTFPCSSWRNVYFQDDDITSTTEKNMAQLTQTALFFSVNFQMLLIHPPPKSSPWWKNKMAASTLSCSIFIYANAILFCPPVVYK